ncbi:MAG: SAM-dependent methyltransferase, partial [Shewanella sp.]
QLGQWYAADHQVLIYEAANLPPLSPRIEYLPLGELPRAKLSSKSTLVIPPAKPLEYNYEILARLGITPADLG